VTVDAALRPNVAEGLKLTGARAERMSGSLRTDQTLDAVSFQ